MLEDQWLFLSMTPEQREELRPLLSVWTSVVIKRLIGQPPNSSHRLWVAIDELPSLQKLEDLTTCLAEGRKYGAVLMLGIQNIPQLLETYSHNVTKTLIDLCSTKLMFRSASQDVAKHISGALGYQETKEIQEGISYGADERDGVNLTSN